MSTAEENVQALVAYPVLSAQSTAEDNVEKLRNLKRYGTRSFYTEPFVTRMPINDHYFTTP